MRNIVRNKHNKSKKVHFPVSIEYRGKPDSADVTCCCGFVDCVAVWYRNSTPSDWTDANGVGMPYFAITDTVVHFLENIHPSRLCLEIKNCDTCNGTGEIQDRRGGDCVVCKGSGRQYKYDKFCCSDHKQK